VGYTDEHLDATGDISGFNQHDHLVMGLLRAIADAVIVGAGTLRLSLTHKMLFK